MGKQVLQFNAVINGCRRSQIRNLNIPCSENALQFLHAALLFPDCSGCLSNQVPMLSSKNAVAQQINQTFFDLAQFILKRKATMPLLYARPDWLRGGLYCYFYRDSHQINGKAFLGKEIPKLCLIPIIGATNWWVSKTLIIFSTCFSHNGHNLSIKIQEDLEKFGWTAFFSSG